MKFSSALMAAGLLATSVSAHAQVDPAAKPKPKPPGPRPPMYDPPGKNQVGPIKLALKIRPKDLVKGAVDLQKFANKYPEKNRVFGGRAHKDTVDYLLREVQKTGAYDAYLQEQVHLWSDSSQTLTVNGKSYVIGGGTYVPNGNVTGPVIPVNNLGCNASDFPSGVSGNIALISRGTCPFSDKVALAGAAGAIGAIIYNNEEGPLSATLGSPSNPLGPYVPTAFALKADGEEILANRPPPPVANVYVNAVFENRTTYNVVAQTKGGDKNNVVALGAHTDSVNEGPGINDNGSGTIGLLTVAKALAKYKVKNAVRFHWWTAEEFGLLGAEYYVDQLTPAEAAKIRLYLNFDMIASPNYAYQIYDGDGSAFNITGPPGSAQIEKLFEDFYALRGLSSVPTAFDGRSDYGPFLDVGIAAGGLFTGAEDLKTEDEAKAFGGKAGEAYDACYHQACDDIKNLNLEAFTVNTKAIAVAIGTYANDLRSIPIRTAQNKREIEALVAKRQASAPQRKAEAAKSAVRSCNHVVTTVEI